VDTAPEARVIASFTFIVALMLGVSGPLDQLLTSLDTPLSSPELARLVIALLPFAATAVAFQAGRAAEAAWARALGGAAVMLGALTCLGGILYFLAYT
jgi:hypothetical protein